MCVYEAQYYSAIRKRDAAIEEINRCREAISYFKSWQGKVLDCIGFLDSLKEQNKVIATQSNEIILNGKPIDEGERHYPNGNGESFTVKLIGIKGGLSALNSEFNRNINDLNNSLEKNIKLRDEANYVLSYTPTPPCGYCYECCPPPPDPEPEEEASSSES